MTPKPTKNDLDNIGSMLRDAELERINDERLQRADLTRQLENARKCGRDWAGQYFRAHDEARYLRHRLADLERERWTWLVPTLILAAWVLWEAAR